MRTGIRNSVGLEFNPKDKTLWFTDNQTDGMGDDIPAGEINRATKAGQFFGYPWKQGKTRITEIGYDKDPLPPNITDPQVLHGRARRRPRPRVLHRQGVPGEVPGRPLLGAARLVEPHHADRRARHVHEPEERWHADKTEVFAEGWLDSDTGLYRGRPVDVAMMKDGSMLVSDDFAGALYRVTYAGEAEAPDARRVGARGPAGRRWPCRPGRRTPQRAARRRQPCVVCHGPLGMSRAPDAPNLAGQPAIYLGAQLRAYRSGARRTR